MKLITRDADYAIRAVCFLAKNEGKRITALELNKCLKLPKPFLRKILQRLNKEKIVSSHKGQGGGFSLRAAVNKLSLLDVLIVFQGSICLNDHTFMRKVCPHILKCKIKEKTDELEKVLISGLKSITIASVI